MTSRVTPYEAGWLQFLVDSGLASRRDAEAAMQRVAVAAIEEMERRRAERRRQKRSRRKRREDD
jgi:hypothetical protein